MGDGISRGTYGQTKRHSPYGTEAYWKEKLEDGRDRLWWLEEIEQKRLDEDKERTRRDLAFYEETLRHGKFEKG